MTGIVNWLPFLPYDLPRSKANCPLCGSMEKEVLATLDRRLKRLNHVKCIQCGFIRQYPLPTAGALSEYYSTGYRADYQGRTSAPTSHHIEKRGREAARRLRNLKDFTPVGSAVLDCGCGSGEFVELLAKSGYQAAGFEPGNGYADYARVERKLNVTCASLESYQPKLPNDAVTSFHVFEHLTDPLTAFAKLASFTHPDGVIYIEVPNMQNALHKGFGSLHLAHTIGFTRPTLELLGAICGYVVDFTDDSYDIGMIFRRGTPRALADIMAEGRDALRAWNYTSVHRQFWRYSLRKILPGSETT